MIVLRNLLRLGVWVLSFTAIAAYVILAVHRLPYPLELDCIEGVMMDHIARLAAGQHMYVAPSLHYVPLAYMPLFATVSSLLARVWGPEFWQPRLVSLVASLVLTGMMCGVVYAETRRRTLAIAAPGIFLMAFAFNGACYDIARPDSLMLCLTFAGLTTLRFTTGVRGALVAALLLTLGFFTKQHAVLFAIGALAYLVFHDRRRALPFGLAIVLGCAGGYALLTAWLGEWFRVFTWSIPRGWSQISPIRIQHYVGANLFGALGALSISSVLSVGAADAPWRDRTALWYWAGLAAVGTGFMATLDAYAYNHLFMPSMTGICFLGPIALDRLIRHLEKGGSGASTSANGLGLCAAYVVLMVQFLPFLYPIHSLQPHPLSRAAHARFIQILREIPGDVLMPYHGWYDFQSGREGSLQIIPFEDIGRSRGNALVRKEPHYLERMLDPLRRGPGRPTLIMDEPLEQANAPWGELSSGYQLVDSLGWITEPLRPVAGNKFAPRYIYKPVEPPAEVAPQ